jgi:hypothetical protein
MHQLDLHNDTKTSINISPNNFDPSNNSTPNTVPTEKYIDHCTYIIQWLHLVAANRMKPVRYSLTRHPDILSWHESIRFKLHLLQKLPLPHLDNKSSSPPMPTQIQTQPIPTILPDSIQTQQQQQHNSSIQQLTVNTLIEMRESLEASRLHAERKDEQKERSFQKLPVPRRQMILNASSPPPFLEPAEAPTDFYESILKEKSAFKAKQLINHELSVAIVKRFKVSPALAASIWIGDLISDEINPSNLSIWLFPERSHTDAKDSELERGLWIMDSKHVCSDISILSKTTIYMASWTPTLCYSTIEPFFNSYLVKTARSIFSSRDGLKTFLATVNFTSSNKTMIELS